MKKFWFMTFHIKTLFCSKPMSSRFVKVDGFMRVYEGIRYLVLFGPKKYDAIYDKIRYRISQKSRITSVISHNFAKIKFELYDALPLEKTLKWHKFVILIKSVFNKDHSCQYKHDILWDKILLQKVEINMQLLGIAYPTSKGN